MQGLFFAIKDVCFFNGKTLCQLKVFFEKRMKHFVKKEFEKKTILTLSCLHFMYNNDASPFSQPGFGVFSTKW